MDPLDLQPWLGDCLEVLEPNLGERVIQIGGHPRPMTAALRRAVGPAGRVTVLEADRTDAELAATDAASGVEIVHAALSPPPSLGRHDCLIAVRESGDLFPARQQIALVRTNLRPGGRFLIDLPAPKPCELLQEAWRAAGGPQSSIASWTGPDANQLAEEFTASGMRGVEGASTTHLVRAESPRMLAAWLMARTDEAEPDLHDSLTIALTEAFRDQGPCDAVVHRSRVRGIF